MNAMDTACIEFTGCIDGGGYGRSRYKGKSDRAHRNEYRKHHGDIPDGLCVRHKCDNPRCVNIEHLELGTHKDTMQDRTRRERHPVKKLSDQDIVDIKVALETPYRGVGRDLAAKYGVKESTISGIRNNRRRTDG